jgi:hypothetical protein
LICLHEAISSNPLAQYKPRAHEQRKFKLPSGGIDLAILASVKHLPAALCQLLARVSVKAYARPSARVRSSGSLRTPTGRASGRSQPGTIRFCMSALGRLGCLTTALDGRGERPFVDAQRAIMEPVALVVAVLASGLKNLRPLSAITGPSDSSGTVAARMRDAVMARPQHSRGELICKLTSGNLR